jgi:predicted dehydrogenase
MIKSTSCVRCAVIGLGMGNGHAEGYSQTPEAKLVAVVDLDSKRLTKWSARIGPEACFSDYKTMLRKVKPDLVSVALPNVLHAPVTIDALRAGAHVLCEKPMAVNVAQALSMKRAAEKARRLLGINLSYRFTPQARALKDMADDGFLGRVYHAHSLWTRRDGFPQMGSWFGRKALAGGGPLIDLGVHRIDLAMWLMGDVKPVSVCGAAHYRIGVPRAKARNLKFDVEDMATGFVRFDTGASLILEISWAGHQAEPEAMRTTVYGSKGSLVHRNTGGSYDFVGEFYTEQRGHKIEGRVVAASANLRSAYGEMVHSVINAKRPLADADDGLRIQRVLDGLYASAATGREVRIGA